MTSVAVIVATCYNKFVSTQSQKNMPGARKSNKQREAELERKLSKYRQKLEQDAKDEKDSQRVMFGIYVTPAFKRLVQAVSDEEGTSMSGLVRRLITGHALDKYHWRERDFEAKNLIGIIEEPSQLISDKRRLAQQINSLKTSNNALKKTLAEARVLFKKATNLDPNF